MEHKSNHITDAERRKMLARIEKIDAANYQTQNATDNVAAEILIAVKHKTKIMEAEGKTFDFKPKMIYDTVQRNNPKYFADYLWTHSDEPKNLKANPKNKVYFQKLEKGWYRLHKDVSRD